MSKSVSKIQKWTKKMSNFPKCRDFMKNTFIFFLPDLFDATHRKNNAKFVTVNFYIFF